MTTAWSTLPKPVRGAAPDGFISDSNDGFNARGHTSGLFAPDGDWTPTLEEYVSWALVAKPTSPAVKRGAHTSTSVRGAATTSLARGAYTDSGDGWIRVIVP